MRNLYLLFFIILLSSCSSTERTEKSNISEIARVLCQEMTSQPYINDREIRSSDYRDEVQRESFIAKLKNFHDTYGKCRTSKITQVTPNSYSVLMLMENLKGRYFHFLLDRKEKNKLRSFEYTSDVIDHKSREKLEGDLCRIFNGGDVWSFGILLGEGANLKSGKGRCLGVKIFPRKKGGHLFGIKVNYQHRGRKLFYSNLKFKKGKILIKSFTRRKIPEVKSLDHFEKLSYKPESRWGFYLKRMGEKSKKWRSKSKKKNLALYGLHSFFVLGATIQEIILKPYMLERTYPLNEFWMSPQNYDEQMNFVKKQMSMKTLIMGLMNGDMTASDHLHMLVSRKNIQKYIIKNNLSTSLYSTFPFLRSGEYDNLLFYKNLRFRNIYSLETMANREKILRNELPLSIKKISSIRKKTIKRKKSNGLGWFAKPEDLCKGWDIMHKDIQKIAGFPQKELLIESFDGHHFRGSFYKKGKDGENYCMVFWGDGKKELTYKQLIKEVYELL